MKKIFALVFVLALVISINASFGRLNGFSIYSQLWDIDDSAQILLFPNEIVNYSSMAQFNNIDIGQADTWFNGGFNFKLRENMFLGVYLNNPQTPLISSIDDDEPSTDTVGYNINYIDINHMNNNVDLSINRLFDLIYALKLNNNFIVGMLFNYAYHSYNNNDHSILSSPLANGNRKENKKSGTKEMNFKVNVTLKDFSFFNLIDLGVQFGLPSYNLKYIQERYNSTDSKWYEYSNVSAGTNGANNFGFWTRLNTNIVDFYFNFSSAKLDHNWKKIMDTNWDGTINSNLGENITQGINNMTFSIAKVVKNEKYLLHFNLLYSAISEKWNSIEKDNLNDIIVGAFNYKNVYSYINGTGGIEYYIKKWFTLRCGLEYFWELSDSTDIDDPDYTGGTVTSTMSNSDNESTPSFLFVMTGVSFHFNKIDIDISLPPYSVFYGTFILTGASGVSPYTWSAALVYHW